LSAVRTGIIYILSAFAGGLMAALFVEDSPQVCSSAALFGLIGASFAGLIRDWKLYTKKVLLPLDPHTLFLLNQSNYTD